MSTYRRNILVGFTVMGALVILGWMILTFAGRSLALLVKPSLPVTFISDRADGLSEGSAITYRGVQVGHVTRTRRLENQTQVAVDASMDPTPPLPANVNAIIHSQGILGGTSSIVLELHGAVSSEHLKPGQIIAAKYVGLDFMPPEFTALADDLRLTSRQFRESNLIPHLDETVRALQDQIAKIGQAVDSVQQLVGDKKMREDLQASIANFRSATEGANRISANLEKLTGQASNTLKSATTTIDKTQMQIDTLSRQMSDRLTQVAKLLETFQQISNKVNKGDGTVGLLLNDPKLYQSLVDTSRELNATIKDLQRLVQQWEQEGVYFKLK
jgi:phospholipid/cholesterol/gamma-HCH transport system substrate-binding protein